MSSITLFFMVVCIIGILFLILNFIFAPHNPYPEKYSIFECGFHSFLGQNRIQFMIVFFIYGILYLVFDLEVMSLYPLAVSMYTNNIYGLSIALCFVAIVSLGFVYELGKGALNIYSRQNLSNLEKKNSIKASQVTPIESGMFPWPFHFITKKIIAKLIVMGTIGFAIRHYINIHLIDFGSKWNLFIYLIATICTYMFAGGMAEILDTMVDHELENLKNLSMNRNSEGSSSSSSSNSGSSSSSDGDPGPASNEPKPDKGKGKAMDQGGPSPGESSSDESSSNPYYLPNRYGKAWNESGFAESSRQGALREQAEKEWRSKLGESSDECSEDEKRRSLKRAESAEFDEELRSGRLINKNSAEFNETVKDFSAMELFKTLDHIDDMKKLYQDSQVPAAQAQLEKLEKKEMVVKSLVQSALDLDEKLKDLSVSSQDGYDSSTESKPGTPPAQDKPTSEDKSNTEDKSNISDEKVEEVESKKRKGEEIDRPDKTKKSDTGEEPKKGEEPDKGPGSNK